MAEASTPQVGQSQGGGGTSPYDQPSGSGSKGSAVGERWRGSVRDKGRLLCGKKKSPGIPDSFADSGVPATGPSYRTV